MLRQALPIARTTFVEALRQPVVMILILVSGLFQVFNTANTGFTLGLETSQEITGDNKLLLDIGMATVFLCGTLLAAFVATATMSREIENKTVLTVVSKPVGRPTLVLGKYLGVASAITFATLTMLLFLLFAIRHRVMETAADELDGPVLTFSALAVLLSIALAAWCNYFYSWSFPQVVVIALLPLSFCGYLLVLMLSPEWQWQPIMHDLRPQVTLACACLILAILVLSAVAVAASTRLGQVMTIVACLGVFLAALLSNYVVGRHVFHNDVIGIIKAVQPDDTEHPDFDATGNVIRISLKQAPAKALHPGDSFYFSASPSGFPMSVPDFPPFSGRVDDANQTLGPDTPGRLLIVHAEGLDLRVRHVGAAALPILRVPEVGDYVFLNPTRTNYALLATWGGVPNLHFFWLLDAVSQNRPVPPQYLVAAAGYAMAQIVAFLSLGIFLFQRRDVG